MQARFGALLDILFPPACPACGRVLHVPGLLCDWCDLQVESLPSPHCSRCAEPGEFPRELCPRCERRPSSFSRAFAPYAHEGPLARAIHRFKYEDRPELASTLSQLLVESSFRFLISAPATVCAIPLHRKRFLERKYDQSQLLAREVARRTARTHAILLRRTRATQRQVGLSEADRELNLADAFEASGPVRGVRILLVDDVVTTGATARAAARALLQAGAAEVQVLALARAFSRP